MGKVQFTDLKPIKYLVRVSFKGFEDGISPIIDLEKENPYAAIITLKTKTKILDEVTIVSKKPLIQFLPDKIIINPEANISNAGATVMDVLEKSPGITVGKDGSIIMKENHQSWF